MCGRAAISYSAADIADACRAAGLPLPPNTPAPAEYRVGSKSCEDKTKHNPAGKRGVEAWPCVVRDGGTLRLETQKFGIQRLATHCIWCDGGEWVERKNWREALEAGRLCAVAVTAFAEGITCRMEEDGGLFFLAAIYRGDHFVLLTTDACTTPLLRERALVQREHGAGGHRCPLYMDARAAARWLETPPNVGAALASVARLEAAIQSPAAVPRLVLGKAGTTPKKPSPGGGKKPASPWAAAAAAPASKRPRVDDLAAREEEQLRAAIAASLADSAPPPTAASSSADDERERARLARLARFGA